MSPGHEPPLWVLLKSRVMSSAWGVPEASIVIVGWGPFDPINRSNKASNRRVEIVVGERM